MNLRPPTSSANHERAICFLFLAAVLAGVLALWTSFGPLAGRARPDADLPLLASATGVRL